MRTRTWKTNAYYGVHRVLHKLTAYHCAIRYIGVCAERGVGVARASTSFFPAIPLFFFRSTSLAISVGACGAIDRSTLDEETPIDHMLRYGVRKVDEIRRRIARPDAFAGLLVLPRATEKDGSQKRLERSFTSSFLHLDRISTFDPTRKSRNALKNLFLFLSGSVVVDVVARKNGSLSRASLQIRLSLVDKRLNFLTKYIKREESIVCSRSRTIPSRRVASIRSRAFHANGYAPRSIRVSVCR